MKLNDIKIINAILDGKEIKREGWQGRVVGKDSGMAGLAEEDALAEDWVVAE